MSPREYGSPVVSVVVPTLDSARTLRACLESLRAQSHACELVVVDGGSTDSTVAIARELADVVLVVAPSRTAQRNRGAAAARGDVLGFVDADMVLEPEVVAQAVAAVRAGAVGVVVPETSVGPTYWARVRAFERSFYEGVPEVEAARFFPRSAFEAVKGFDEGLEAVEDTDVSARVALLGRIARTDARILHDEGPLGYRQACRKKASYAEGIAEYARARGTASLWRFLAARPYLHRPWLLLSRPGLGAGVVALKSGETLAVLARLCARTRPAQSLSHLGERAATLASTVRVVSNWPVLLPSYLRCRSAPSSERTLVFRLRSGASLVVPADPRAAWPAFETAVRDVYRFRRLDVRHGFAALVDVGAHVGAATVAFHERFPHAAALCVEPSPAARRLLEANLARNGIRATVLAAAVGGREGTARLLSASAADCEAHLDEREADGPSDVVATTTLGSVLSRAPAGPLLLKMDVEGAEHAALAAATAAELASVEAVVLEYHPADGRDAARWVARRLAELGFEPAWHAPDRHRHGLGTAAFQRPGAAPRWT